MNMMFSKHLEPQTAIYKWLFQLDDSQSLHRKWLFHDVSCIYVNVKICTTYIYIV